MTFVIPGNDIRHPVDDIRPPAPYVCGDKRRDAMAVEIEQFMCRSDNFGVLVHDPKSKQTAIIDAPEEAAILAAVKRTGWTPTMILTTHHHMDHVEANLALKERFKLRIVGPEAEKAKIP